MLCCPMTTQIKGKASAAELASVRAIIIALVG
jgi:hypothetical protein